jgi:hypothetical protein
LSRIVTIARAALAALSLVLSAPAWAAPRYASPSGGGDCLTTPCSLATAITGANPGDEVIVGPGTYAVETKITAPVALSIHGAVGQARPRIVGASTVTPLESFATLHVSDLRIESTDSDLGSLFVVGDGSTFTRLQLLATRTDDGSGLALRPGTTFILRDSLLIASGGMFSGAVFIQGVATGLATIRNVTAIASGSESTGIAVTVVNPSATVTVDVRNVIAVAATDFSAAAPSGAVVFNVSYSNFDSASGITAGVGNQSAAPVFVDLAAEDYHQAPGSPTIDAGVDDPQNGSSDLDGNPRPTGPVPDIGAYEYQPPPTTTTTTLATATTSTTLPCVAEATFASVACRLAGLAADLDAHVPAGALRDKLQAAVGDAQASAGEAGTAVTKRARRRAIRRALHALDRCRARLRSQAGKALDELGRDALIDRLSAVKSDLKTLRRS